MVWLGDRGRVVRQLLAAREERPRTIRARRPIRREQRTIRVGTTRTRTIALLRRRHLDSRRARLPHNRLTLDAPQAALRFSAAVEEDLRAVTRHRIQKPTD